MQRKAVHRKITTQLKQLRSDLHFYSCSSPDTSSKINGNLINETILTNAFEYSNISLVREIEYTYTHDEIFLLKSDRRTTGNYCNINIKLSV